MSSNNDNKNILSQARELVHDTVKTPARDEAEKNPIEKMKDAMPDNAKEAGSKVGETLDKVAQDAKNSFDKFQKEAVKEIETNNQNDGDPLEGVKDTFGNVKDSITGAVDNVRERIYEATKPSDDIPK